MHGGGQRGKSPSRIVLMTSQRVMNAELIRGGVTHAEPANHRAPVNLPNRLLNTSDAAAPSSHARSVLGRLGTTTEREFFCRVGSANANAN